MQDKLTAELLDCMSRSVPMDPRRMKRLAGMDIDIDLVNGLAGHYSDSQEMRKAARRAGLPLFIVHQFDWYKLEDRYIPGMVIAAGDKRWDPEGGR